MMHRAAFALAAAVTALPLAAGAATTAFDGGYAGTVAPIGPLSDAQCTTVAGYAMTVTNGTLSGAAPTGLGRITAVVTADGFVTGQMRLGDGTTYPLEGRIVDGTLDAGMFTQAGGRACSWVFTLAREVPGLAPVQAALAPERPGLIPVDPGTAGQLGTLPLLPRD